MAIAQTGFFRTVTILHAYEINHALSARIGARRRR